MQGLKSMQVFETWATGNLQTETQGEENNNKNKKHSPKENKRPVYEHVEIKFSDLLSEREALYLSQNILLLWTKEIHSNKN